MNRWIVRALALGAITLAVGCAPLPKLLPVETQAAQMLQLGEPFAYRIEGEPTDIGEARTALTLEACVRDALEHDPRIQSALSQLRQAEADARQTRLLPNPVIGVSLRFPEGGGKSIIDADVSAELLSLLTLPGRISAADSRLRKASGEALTTVLDVVLEVQRQYAVVQSLHERIAVEESRRGILQQLVSVTDARVKAGEAAKLDALTAQASFASLETELMGLRSQERVARLALVRLIGQPSAPTDWSASSWTPGPLPQLPEATWIALAMEHRPELSAVRWELAALGQEVRLAKLEPWTGGVGAAAERDGSWSIGPSASVAIPIFDTGDVSKAKREAMVTDQKHQLTRITRQIVEDVRRSLEQARSTDEVLERTKRELIPLQEQRLKQAQDAYRIGLADVLTLRLAEQDFQETRSRVIELQNQRIEARFALDRAVGGPGAYAASTTHTTTFPTENNP
jgi:cobalt-zinc-cadmium efflux system outer membrane protein